MKRFFFKQLSLVLILAMLLSLVAVAEDGADSNAPVEVVVVSSDETPQDNAEVIVFDEEAAAGEEAIPEPLSDTDLLSDIVLDGLLLDDGTEEELMESPYDSLLGESNAKSGVPATLTLGEKMTYTLNTKKLGKKVTFKSNKTKVATVDKKGVITAKKKGEAKITCIVNKKTVATCVVTVLPAPSKVTLAYKTLNIGKNESVKLEPIIKEGTLATFTFKTKDKKIASVSDKGVVKGLKVGKSTTITVTTHNKKSFKLKVNVMKAPDKVKSITPVSAELNMGETVQLKATLPDKTASQFTWSSNNKKVATVDKDGLVTAVGAGTAKITVKTFNKKKKTCTVTVKAPVVTAAPTATPTVTPTAVPTATPTAVPTATPTVAPTATSTMAPTATPTAAPTAAPTATPTVAPTATPTAAPTAAPSATPTATPTAAPTATPTATPTAKPALKSASAEQASFTVVPEASATLKVITTCEGAPSLTYKWFREGAEIAGATEVSYAAPTDAVGTVNYKCVVSDGETSKDVNFSVTVNNYLTASAVSPTEQTIFNGQTVTLEVSADCAKGTPTYQWYKDGAAIDNARSSSYTSEAISTKTTFKCEVGDAYGSALVSLSFTVNTKEPSLVSASAEVATFHLKPTETATLQVDTECDGQPTLTYAWYEGTDPVTAGVGDSYKSLSVTATTVGEKTYRCDVSDGATSKSVSFTVNVDNALTATAVGETTQTVLVSQTATLKVAASCLTDDKLTCTWYRGNETDAVGTGKEFTTEAFSQAGEYKYRCVVNDGYGSEEKTVEFTVTAAVPKLLRAYTETPEFTIAPNQTATLEVKTECFGTPTLTYEWTLNDAVLSDAENVASYTTKAEAAATVGEKTYQCSISDGTDADPAVVTFTVTVDNALTATASETSQTVFVGETATLAVDASCLVGDRTYQWYIVGADSDAPISGATEASFTTDPITETTTFKCVVGDEYGSMVDPIVFTVNTKIPTLTNAAAETASFNLKPTDEATLQVNLVLDGKPTLTYAWYEGDSTEPFDSGSGNDFATITKAVTASAVGEKTYSCKVSDGTDADPTVVTFTATVDNALKATAASESSKTVFIGQTATLAVEANCLVGDPTYQWYTVDGESDTAIGGATADSFTSDPIAATTTFKCVVGDEYGSVVAPVVFTVTAVDPAANGILIDKDNFPDDNFRAYVQGFDADSSGALSDAEIGVISEISVNDMAIGLLDGIEYFTSLKKLDCSGNQLISLDVSQNTALEELNCGFNPLTTLAVDGCTSLTKLECDHTNLMELDLRNNSALAELFCYDCALTALDVSNNHALEVLNCGNAEPERTNAFTTLDVSNNPQLKTLYCFSGSLKSLELDGADSLVDLKCYGNQLRALDVSHNAALKGLNCAWNELETLSVIQNPQLEVLGCNNNGISTLDVSNCSALADCITKGTKTVENGYVSYTYGENWLDVDDGVVLTPAVATGIAINSTNFPDDNFRAWVLANCDPDGSTTLSDDEIAAVTTMKLYTEDSDDIQGFGITSLEGIEFFTELTNLDCSYNEIPSLDLRANPNLVQLICSCCHISSIDLSGNPELEELCFEESDIRTIDLSHNPKLKTFVCNCGSFETLDFSHNPLLESLSFFDCGANSVNLSNNEELKRFRAVREAFAVDVSNCPKLEYLKLEQHRGLKSLNLANNPALTELEVFDTELSSLDLSHNPALEKLTCGWNELSELDVTHNPELTELECPYSKLTSIDLSRNTKLLSLRLEDNQLTTLDISACPSLIAMIKLENLEDEDEYVSYSVYGEDYWYQLSYDNGVQVITEAAVGDYIMSNGVITGYRGNGGAITLPEQDDEGNDITAIGASAFAGITSITSIAFPATLTEIGESAFEGCTGLESVTIPNGVSEIGEAAFMNCEKLESMETFD